MNRLTKKSFLASTGLHLLLAVILLVGAAFVASPGKRDNMASRSKSDDMPVLDYVTPATVDDALAGAGAPHASAQLAIFDKRPTAPSVPAARPAPPPERIPPKDRVRDSSPPTDSKETQDPSTDRRPKKPTFDYTPVTRLLRDAQADANNRAEGSAQQQGYERQVAAWQHNLSAEVGSVLKDLENGRSGSTTFAWPGPGDGNLPYANFYQLVKSVYSHAWTVPDGVTDESATVGVSVTIARDGGVLSARITRPSRNPAVDHSVQATLDRVNFAAPLPAGAQESQRTVSINFNVAARRALE